MLRLIRELCSISRSLAASIPLAQPSALWIFRISLVSLRTDRVSGTTDTSGTSPTDSTKLMSRPCKQRLSRVPYYSSGLVFLSFPPLRSGEQPHNLWHEEQR